MASFSHHSINKKQNHSPNLQHTSPYASLARSGSRAHPLTNHWHKGMNCDNWVRPLMISLSDLGSYHPKEMC